MRYYKVLNKHEACHGGKFVYKPRVWTPRISKLIACQRGYHICTRDQLIWWLNNDIWEVDARDTRNVDNRKYASRQIRLKRKVQTWNKDAKIKMMGYFGEQLLQYVFPSNDLNQIISQKHKGIMPTSLMNKVLQGKSSISRELSIIVAPHIIECISSFRYFMSSNMWGYSDLMMLANNKLLQLIKE